MKVNRQVLPITPDMVSTPQGVAKLMAQVARTTAISERSGFLSIIEAFRSGLESPDRRARVLREANATLAEGDQITVREAQVMDLLLLGFMGMLVVELRKIPLPQVELAGLEASPEGYQQCNCPKCKAEEGKVH